MEIRNLRTFAEVCRCKSFSAAAENLGYAQSSVTMQIKQLESEIGDLLFERINKKIFITPKGEKLLAYALDTLEKQQSLMESLMDDGQIRGSLRLGVLESVGAAFLPSVLAEFKTACPMVNVVIKTGNSHQLTQLLKENQLDLIWIFDEKTADDRLVGKFCAPHKLSIVSAFKDTGDAEAQSEALPYEFSFVNDKNFILGEDDCCYRLMLTDIFAFKGIVPHILLEIDNTEIIRKLVSADLGYAFLPYFLVEEAVKNRQLSVINIKNFNPLMYSQLIQYHSKMSTKAMDIFISTVKENSVVKHFSV